LNHVRILVELPLVVKFELIVRSLARVTEETGDMAQSFGYVTHLSEQNFYTCGPEKL